MAGTAGPPHAAAVSLEMSSLPRAFRAVSLADVPEPIPLTWIVRSGVLIGVAILVAIVLAIATHCHGSDSRPATASRASAGSSEHAAPSAPSAPSAPAASGTPARPVATPARPAAPAPAVAPGAKPADRDAQLKALVRDLEAGKTCGDRRAAIGKLVELGDARAVPALRRATMRGGPGDQGNACLKSDADRAIKELAPPR